MAIYKFSSSNSSYAPMSSVSEAVSLKPSDFTDIVYSEGTYFKNCSNLVTEEMIAECWGNRSLIEQSAILEGAKLDLTLKNFLKEGQDYKGLKADLEKVIKANDISNETLKSDGRKFLHICKRILQVMYDISPILGIPVAGAQVATGVAAANMKADAASAIGDIFGVGTGAAGGIIKTGITVSIFNAIISYIIGFIINRLIRFLIDTIEFKTIKDDAEDVVRELRLNAKKAKDPKIAKKMESEADRLEESIAKYSKKK